MNLEIHTWLMYLIRQGWILPHCQQWPCGKEILKQHIAGHQHGILNILGLQKPLSLCPFSPGSCQEHLTSADAQWKKTRQGGEIKQRKNTGICKEDE